MKNLFDIIQEEVERTIYEEHLLNLVNENIDKLLFEKKKKKKQSKHKKKKANKTGVGTDTIERSNRKAYNNDIINGSELARRAHITNSKNDDTIRSLASKYWGHNKNARKPSKKQNKKMHAQVTKL